MTRRDTNWLIAKAAGTAGAAQFLAPWLAAAEIHRHGSPPPDPHDWNSYRPRFFSAEEFEWSDAFTAIPIPTDETPGARAAQVATCRTGENPQASVLNSFCQTHDSGNPFVFGGGTTDGKHPTLTMMALTARGCDHLLDPACKKEL